MLKFLVSKETVQFNLRALALCRSTVLVSRQGLTLSITSRALSYGRPYWSLWLEACIVLALETQLMTPGLDGEWLDELNLHWENDIFSQELTVRARFGKMNKSLLVGKADKGDICLRRAFW